MKPQSKPLIVILGPTAVGKTKVAAKLAAKKEGEVISADSRQVYRKMDIGSGKDLEEFQIEGKQIPYHLIDIKDAGEAYDVFNFQRDFYACLSDIEQRSKWPILCGGSGLYIEAAISNFQYLEVPKDQKLRSELEERGTKSLEKELRAMEKNLHNTTDLKDRDRMIRAIEIARYKQEHEPKPTSLKAYRLYGIRMEREALRQRIRDRLDQRLGNGLIEEVKGLLESGISKDVLLYYGLEYRYLALYLSGEIDYEMMYDKLLQGIRRFAKKQMTWYRRMEKQGEEIHWLDASMGEEKLCELIEKDYER